MIKKECDGTGCMTTRCEVGSKSLGIGIACNYGYGVRNRRYEKIRVFLRPEICRISDTEFSKMFNYSNGLAR